MKDLIGYLREISYLAEIGRDASTDKGKQTALETLTESLDSVKKQLETPQKYHATLISTQGEVIGEGEFSGLESVKTYAQMHNQWIDVCIVRVMGLVAHILKPTTKGWADLCE